MTLRLAPVLAALLLVVSHARAQEPPAPIPMPAATLPAEPPPMPVPPARALPLAEALALATREASDPRLAQFAVRRAEAAQRTALATLLPSLNGQANYTHYDREIQSNIGGATVTIRPDYGYDLDLIATESLSLRSWNATQIAAERTDAARLNVDDARRRTRAAAARAWFAVLTARGNAEVARSQLAQAIRNDQFVAARVELGTGVPLDRARSELAVLDAAQRVTLADAQLGSQWDLLGQALAQDGPVDAVEGAGPDAGETLAHYVDRALASRPDLRAQGANIRAAERTVDDAWYRFLPTLQLSWTGVYRGPATIFQPDGGAWTLLGSLVIPFYDGGARYAAMDDARAQVADAREREALLRRSVRVEVRDAFRRAETSQRAIALAEQSLAVAEANAARSETVYREGAANGLELEDARRSLEQTQLTLLLRRLDRELAVIDLLAASGQI